MNEKVKEVMRFCVAGLIATLIQYIIYYLLVSYIDEKVALSIGYIISFGCNYVMTARFTFKAKATTKNASGFALSHLINWELQVIILSMFIGLGAQKMWAPIPMYMICAPINFLLVRFFFKSTITKPSHILL